MSKDFREALRKAVGLPDEVPQNKPIRSEHAENPITEITLPDGSKVRVGDTLVISMSTGEILAQPVIERVISSTEIQAGGQYINIINTPNIRKAPKQ